MPSQPSDFSAKARKRRSPGSMSAKAGGAVHQSGQQGKGSQSASVQRVVVSDGDDGQRVDNFLTSRLKGLPKSHLYKLLRSGQVRVNGGRVKPASRLSSGDEVRIPPVRLPDPGEKKPAAGWQLAQIRDAVLFEDEALIILNKPAGLAVHGGSGINLGVIELARQVWPKDSKLELVHRLDRDTSGVLVLARTRQALLAMQEQLREHQMEKTYSALVKGKWPKSIKVIDAPLQRNQLKSGERMVRVSEEGKAAESHFRVLQPYRGGTVRGVELPATSLVAVQILSGRTHQIRVHCQLAGHVLLGDDKYGERELNRNVAKAGLKRMFLHASKLVFRHPLSGDRVEIEAPLAEDLQSLLSQLTPARR